jgi:hypothetical protein
MKRGIGRNRSAAQLPRTAVSAAFAAFPAPVRARLLNVRDLIFDTAASTEGVGELDEALKWGEPAYLTARSGSGSTIRLGQDRKSGAAAIHFICHTNLVDEFRRLYPDALCYAGNRSILLPEGAAVDEAALRHCIALALTYHLRKKHGRAAA